MGSRFHIRRERNIVPCRTGPDFIGGHTISIGFHPYRSRRILHVQLVTVLGYNMKNKLLPLYDKILLRKRSVIETINDELKNVAQLVHSRHRSVLNFAMNALAAIAAYSFFNKKPSINIDFCIEDKGGQLNIF